MDLNYSKEDEAFRAEIRTWLEANKPKSPLKVDWGDDSPLWLDWRQKLYEKGWVGAAWAKEFGGKGFTVMQQVVWNEECTRADIPSTQGRSGEPGIFMVAPTLMAFGTQEQKERFIPRILSGEDRWCQGFSEPTFGSDMAGLQAKAVEDGDDYLITGQKIWTSGAMSSNWCFYLARTDPEAYKHRGITYFLVEMNTPGIEIRPIKQLTEEVHFCEMFWDKVRVPKKNIVGGLNNGWKAAMATLANERSGLSSVVRYQRTLARVTDLAKRLSKNGKPMSKDPVIRKRLVQLHFDALAQMYTAYRNLPAMIKGDTPGPEAYVNKVFGPQFFQRMNALGVEMQGPYGQLWLDSPEAVDEGVWPWQWAGARAVTIAGGTSEINRNLVAERALGLPSWKTAAKLAKEGKFVG